mmetsp:Transcript_45312/g.124748  ORF Transcript_45312/g.124748 Transcript_45312/m.124748 type:complete len:158 (-) Transcript_45312:200-673(-)
MAMASLCEVYRAARALWPVETTYNVEDGGAAEGAEEVKESDEAGPMVVAATDLSRPASVTIEIAQLKARIIDDIFMPSYEVRDAWVLVKKNATEAVVELRPTADINKFNAGELQHPSRTPRKTTDQTAGATKTPPAPCAPRCAPRPSSRGRQPRQPR